PAGHQPGRRRAAQSRPPGDARSRGEGGAGLGPAIARDVAVRHGGTLTVREAPAGGALSELRLPLPEDR
ncbi:ATP-binding protein, partial [Streptomyces sp. NPDC056527]|uniref:ATP-binding protein n=1 Tax=Streptomyces sp. NPDC056527 TaxID=3345853 RepID=UPI0036C5F154